MRKPKPERLWGITYTNCGDVMPDTIRRTRKEAQHACCVLRRRRSQGEGDWREDWRAWKKAGCRAVRVIVIVEDKP